MKDRQCNSENNNHKTTLVGQQNTDDRATRTPLKQEMFRKVLNNPENNTDSFIKRLIDWLLDWLVGLVGL